MKACFLHIAVFLLAVDCSITFYSNKDCTGSTKTINEGDVISSPDGYTPWVDVFDPSYGPEFDIYFPVKVCKYQPPKFPNQWAYYLSIDFSCTGDKTEIPRNTTLVIFEKSYIPGFCMSMDAITFFGCCTSYITYIE
mmetsp:Transcript_26648/g.37910  ORF Transcript_26648/g.37910 Transcript_26648/m.37910 type:complete len:137 (+) Transcript_26648:28-438(+)